MFSSREPFWVYGLGIVLLTIFAAAATYGGPASLSVVDGAACDVLHAW